MPRSRATRADDRRDRHGPVEAATDRAERTDLLDREHDRREVADGLGARELDELGGGDLDRTGVLADQLGVGVGHDLAHQGGALVGLGEGVDLRP